MMSNHKLARRNFGFPSGNNFNLIFLNLLISLGGNLPQKFHDLSVVGVTQYRGTETDK